MYSNGQNGWDMGFMPMGFGGIGMIIFMLFVAVGIYWLIRLIFASNLEQENGQQPSARELLDVRYARGDIDRGSYLQMCKDLDQHISSQ